MSLIYNALQPQTEESAPMTGTARPQPRHAVRYLHYGLYALASVVTMLVVVSLLPAADGQASGPAVITPPTTPKTDPTHTPVPQQIAARMIPPVTLDKPLNTAKPISTVTDRQFAVPTANTLPHTAPAPVKTPPLHRVRVTPQPARTAPTIKSVPKADTTLQARSYLAEVQQLVNQLQQAMVRKDPTVVEPLLDLLELRAGKDVAISLKMRAYWLLQQNNNRAAASLYQRLLTVQPNDAQANLNMALIELRNGERDKAQARVARLVNLYPDSTRVRRFQQQLGGHRG